MDTQRRLSKIDSIVPAQLVDPAEHLLHCGTGDDTTAKDPPSAPTKLSPLRNSGRTVLFGCIAVVCALKALNHSSRPHDDPCSDHAQDTCAQVRFGDYLQFLVDKQELLRREHS